MRRVWWLFYCALGAPASDQFVGSEACGGCHPAQYKVQKQSRHAQALLPILDTNLPRAFTARPVRDGNAVFSYEPAVDGLKAKVSLANDRAEALLEWAFGAGAQGFENGSEWLTPTRK